MRALPASRPIAHRLKSVGAILHSVANKQQKHICAAQHTHSAPNDTLCLFPAVPLWATIVDQKINHRQNWCERDELKKKIKTKQNRNTEWMKYRQGLGHCAISSLFCFQRSRNGFPRWFCHLKMRVCVCVCGVIWIFCDERIVQPISQLVLVLAEMAIQL